MLLHIRWIPTTHSLFRTAHSVSENTLFRPCRDVVEHLFLLISLQKIGNNCREWCITVSCWFRSIAGLSSYRPYWCRWTECLLCSLHGRRQKKKSIFSEESLSTTSPPVCVFTRNMIMKWWWCCVESRSWTMDTRTMALRPCVIQFLRMNDLSRCFVQFCTCTDVIVFEAFSHVTARMSSGAYFV